MKLQPFNHTFLEPYAQQLYLENSLTTLGFIYRTPSTFSSYHDKSNWSPGITAPQLGLQSDACRGASMVTSRRSYRYICFDVVGRQLLQLSSTSHRQVAQPKSQDCHPIEVLAGILLVLAGKLTPSKRWRG